MAIAGDSPLSKGMEVPVTDPGWYSNKQTLDVWAVSPEQQKERVAFAAFLRICTRTSGADHLSETRLAIRQHQATNASLAQMHGRDCQCVGRSLRPAVVAVAHGPANLIRSSVHSKAETLGR